MSISTGASTLGKNTGKTGGGYTPEFNVGKSQGGYRPSQLQQFSPEQMKLFQSMFSHLGPNSFLSKLAGGDQSAFEQMEAPAMRQFGGLQGQLASRFSGMGTGARRSSGFQNTMNQATSDFAQQLQAQRMGLQRQAMGDLMGFSNQLMGQRPYENQLLKKSPGFLKNLLQGGVEAFAAGAGGGLTGGAGGAVSGAMNGRPEGLPSQGWSSNMNDVWGQNF